MAKIQLFSERKEIFHRNVISTRLAGVRTNVGRRTDVPTYRRGSSTGSETAGGDSSTGSGSSTGSETAGGDPQNPGDGGDGLDQD